MFDEELTRPIPHEEIIPPDKSGKPDWNIENYRYAASGARELVPFHLVDGRLKRLSLGVFLLVLKADAEEKEMKIPRQLIDIISFYGDLRIDELNRKSEYLFQLQKNLTLNVASFSNLVEQGENPSLLVTEWIQNSRLYEGHNLTYESGANYIEKINRPSINPIKDFVDGKIRDPNTSRLLHHAVTSVIFGIQSFKAVIFIIGQKNSGKSVFLNILRKLFGSYSITIPPIMMLPYNEDKLVKELFANQGKRFFRIDELHKESVFNESLVKRITGRDGLSNPFVTHPLREFTPQVKIFCDTNAPLRPQFGKESSISDRLFYFPFREVVPKDLRDPYFEENLSSQENIDLYFSYLVDNFLYLVVKGNME